MSARDPYFELRKSRIQGRGAFATRPIRKGTRIIEYTGERIDQDEANRRYDDDTMGRHHTFLFAVDDDLVIDGAVKGNDSIFINHSCAPNCQAVNEDNRIWIEALRPIEAGEELAYDYAYARTEDNDNPESEALYACRCGAATCRGSILEPPKKTSRARANGAATKAKGGGAKSGGARKASGGAKKGSAAKRGAAGGTKKRAAKGAKRGGTTKRTSR